MHPLEKKEIMKKNFNKRVQEKRSKNNGKIISFKELGITFEPETIEIFRPNRGGAKID